MMIEGAQETAKSRLLIIGDSFIAKGSQSSIFLANLLERHHIKILNLATEGMGPFQYLTELKSNLWFKPDIVLLGYYAGNDLTDVKYWMSRREPRLKTILRPYVRQLFTYHFIKEKIRILIPPTFNFDQMEHKGIDKNLVVLARNQQLNPFLIRTAEYQQRFLLDNHLMDDRKAVSELRRTLDEIYNLCKRNKSKLVIVIFPSSVQINKMHDHFFRQLGFQVDEAIYEAENPQRFILEFCNENGIACLDLLPEFKKRSSENFFREYDIHFNQTGAALAASMVANFVADQVADDRSQATNSAQAPISTG